MRRLLILFAAAGMMLGLWESAQAQAAVQVTDLRVAYDFGVQITFMARIQSPLAITETLLFFQAEGDVNTHVFAVVPGPSGEAVFTYAVQQGAPRPFSQVYFWYKVTLASGEVYTSPQNVFHYNDDRFPWQVLKGSQVQVYWYTGDVAFGQSAYDMANLGLRAIGNLMPVSIGEPIDIYIYATSADLQSALDLSGQSWLAAQASPDLGVVMVSIMPGPEQSIDMERQIPHELAHVLLYQSTGAAYDRLPKWMREGIASLAELYPNADYVTVLGAANRSKALIPLTELCAAFPLDASRAFLAYAESSSFTRYIHENYGVTGLQALIVAYADGLDCENGAIRALGVPLSQLDRQWRQSALGENMILAAVLTMLPYLIVAGLVLGVPLWGMSAVGKRKAKGNAARGR